MSGDNYRGRNVGAMGPGAVVHSVSFDQRTSLAEGGVDLGELARELNLVRSVARQQATDVEHDESVLNLGRAEESAKAGSQRQTFEYLKKAGAWAAKVAATAGAAIVAKVIESQLDI